MEQPPVGKTPDVFPAGGCSMRLDGWEHPAGRGGCGAPRMIYKD
ncbi:hypothetical protein [Faecalicatena contorta]